MKRDAATREHHELYLDPLAYDIAFDVRDVPHECDFMAWCVQHLAGRRLAAAVELGSGPGYHALRYAERGVRSAAIDIEPAMVEYLAAKARARGLDVDVRQADMRSFALDAPVDLAYVLFGSFGYLLTHGDIRENFAAVHAALAPGGLYLLELPHPRRYLRGDHTTQDEWTRERDGVRVTTRWDLDHAIPDPLTQVMDVRSEFLVTAGGRTRRLRTRGRQRAIFAPELVALAEGERRFRVVAWFGAMSRRIPFNYARQSWRMVAVLQKT